LIVCRYHSPVEYKSQKEIGFRYFMEKSSKKIIERRRLMLETGTMNP